MTERRVYVDYNATTPLKSDVKATLINDLDVFGNASSMHTSGRLARAKVEEARESVASLLGSPSSSIIFTSGGSESNNAVFQTMRNLAFDKNEFIITAIEHPCVLKAAEYTKNQGFKVTEIPVDEYGKLNMDAYRAALNDKTLFVSVMMANNEIGVLQDIKQITNLAKQVGAFVHTDAVQAVGKIPVNAESLGVDYLTMSAHKIYGPKGVCALYVKKGAPLYPLIHGGHQE